MESKKNVIVMNHALIKHKIALLKDENTSCKEFRELINEITMLMCYESMKDLLLEEKEIKTPLQTTKCYVLRKKRVTVVPILRAGLGMMDGVIKMIPTAQVGIVGLYRDHKTLSPVEYYSKLPLECIESEFIILDPMLATGGTAVDTISNIKKQRPKSIKFMCILASPQGIETVVNAHPDVQIYCAAKDEGLNKDGYILPGLGDAGDRIFATK